MTGVQTCALPIYEWFVTVFKMAVNHIVVTLVDWQVNGLTNRSTLVMNARRHVSELHEITKIFDG